MRKNTGRQHISAIGRLVLQYSIIQKKDGNAVAYADQGIGRLRLLRQRLAGLGEIDMPRKIREPDCLSDVPAFVKKRIAESCEAETTVKTDNLFVFRILVSLRDTSQAFRGNIP